MKLTKSFEQGVCIMAMIATQIDGTPVSSRTLQRRLGSSMTYSQKILRKLVVAGLIKSVPGNNGGFALARPISQISVLDVVVALEGEMDSFPDTGLFSAIFSGKVNDEGERVISTADQAIRQLFSMADNIWQQLLAQVSLSDIVKRVMTSDTTIPTVDWNDDQVDINDIFTHGQTHEQLAKEER